MDAPLLELKRKLRLIWPHLDERTRKVSREEMKRVKLQPNRFHGEWNYVIHPKPS